MQITLELPDEIAATSADPFKQPVLEQPVGHRNGSIVAPAVGVCVKWSHADYHPSRVGS